MITELDEVLQHHGVKGMKWGRRKQRESSSTESPTFHKESTKKIKQNPDGSSTIPKGFVFNRVGKSTKDVNDSGALYVSHGKEDAARYVKALGPTKLGRLMKEYGEAVQHIETKGPIKVASENQVAKASASFLLKDKSVLKTFNSSLYSSLVTGDMTKNIDETMLKNAISNPTSNEAKRVSAGVSSFLGNKAWASESRKFYDGLRKEGVDAIPDVYDRYVGISKTATIVINPDKLKVTSSTMITKEHMKAGKQIVKQYGKIKPDEALHSISTEETLQHKREVKSVHQDLDDVLQHYGVKGMKWGKRKAASAVSSVKKKTGAAKQTVKDHAGSLKRERSWGKELKNLDKMSTRDIQKKATRVQNENDLKRLSRKRPVGSKKDRKDYLKRGDMSDQELNRKVQRLRAKDQFHRQASEASKQQRDFGKKVVDAAAPHAVNAIIPGGGSANKMVLNAIKSQTRKHSALADNVLVHSMLETNDEMLLDAMYEVDEEELQHYGVKGMKWGKRKASNAVKKYKDTVATKRAARKERNETDKDINRRRKKGEITRKQARNEKWQSFHKHQSTVDKTYKKAYDQNKKRGQSDTRAMKNAYNTSQVRKQQKRAIIGKTILYGAAATKLAVGNEHLAKSGKNIVRSMTGNPIRYANARNMTNVVNEQ